MQTPVSEHLMITRSKSKLLELEGINPFDDDDIDETGNLKGLIDYECNDDFDNDMFQKELKRLRGGNRSPQTILNLSPSKKRKKVKKGKTIKWNLRFGSSCRYRDWDRGPGGFYVRDVEEEIISTLK